MLGVYKNEWYADINSTNHQNNGLIKSPSQFSCFRFLFDLILVIERRINTKDSNKKNLMLMIPSMRNVLPISNQLSSILFKLKHLLKKVYHFRNYNGRIKKYITILLVLKKCRF